MQIGRHVNLLLRNVNRNCFDLTLWYPIGAPLMPASAGDHTRPTWERSWESRLHFPNFNIELEIEV